MPIQLRCRKCESPFRVADGTTGFAPCPRCAAKNLVAVTAKPVVSKKRPPTVRGLGEEEPIEEAVPLAEPVEPAKPKPPKPSPIPAAVPVGPANPLAPRPALEHSVTDKASVGKRPPLPSQIPVVQTIDEPRPIVRPNRASSGGSNAGLTVSIVVGLALLLFCVIGSIGAYLIFGSKSKSDDSVAVAPTSSTASNSIVRPVNPAPPNLRQNDGPRNPAPRNPAPRAGDRPARPARQPRTPRNFGHDPTPIKLPPTPAITEIKVAPLPKDTHAIALPGRVERVAPGGGGRYLVLTFSDADKVAVFDLNVAKIIHTIDVPAGEKWPAAGMSQFVVLNVDENKIRRYDLSSGKQLQEQAYEADGEVVSVVMGAASNGPILISAGANLGRRIEFLDLESLKPFDVPVRVVNGLSGPVDTYFAAANGRSFGGHWGINTHLSPTLLSIETGIAEWTGMNAHIHYVAPFPDGKHVATGGRGIMNNKFEEVGNAVLSKGGAPGIFLTHFLVPAQSGDYYLHVQLGNKDPFGQNNELENEGGTVVVYRLGNPNRLATLRGVEVPGPAEFDGYKSIGLPRGFHYSPEAKCLAVVPPSRDKLMLYRVEVK